MRHARVIRVARRRIHALRTLNGVAVLLQCRQWLRTIQTLFDGRCFWRCVVQLFYNNARRLATRNANYSHRHT